jgi:hypothetical protein
MNWLKVNGSGAAALSDQHAICDLHTIFGRLFLWNSMEVRAVMCTQVVDEKAIRQ